MGPALVRCFGGFDELVQLGIGKPRRPTSTPTSDTPFRISGVRHPSVIGAPLQDASAAFGLRQHDPVVMLCEPSPGILKTAAGKYHRLVDRLPLRGAISRFICLGHDDLS